MIPISETIERLRAERDEALAALERANGAIADYQIVNAKMARKLQELTDNYGQLYTLWESSFLVLDGDTEKLTPLN